MKTIAIVATGGTIAGTGKKGKTAAYHAGEIDIDSIIETIPEINEVAHIKEYQLMNIDSNEMTHEKWLILKNNIEEILSDDTIDGAVVTHGTDTLDETAYFLTLTLNYFLIRFIQEEILKKSITLKSMHLIKDH